MVVHCRRGCRGQGVTWCAFLSFKQFNFADSLKRAHTHTCSLTSVSQEFSVLSSISGHVWDRPPQEAGLDWIWQRFGSSHGGAEEKRQGGQVQRHQVKEGAPDQTGKPMTVYAAGCCLSRHQSAQRARQGKEEGRFGPWLGFQGLVSSIHSSSDFKWNNTRTGINR